MSVSLHVQDANGRPRLSARGSGSSSSSRRSRTRSPPLIRASRLSNNPPCYELRWR